MNDRGSLGTSAKTGQSLCVKDFLRAMGISPVRVASTVLHPGGFKVMDGCYWTVDNPSSSVWPDPLSITDPLPFSRATVQPDSVKRRPSQRAWTAREQRALHLIHQSQGRLQNMPALWLNSASEVSSLKLISVPEGPFLLKRLSGESWQKSKTKTPGSLSLGVYAIFN